MATVLTNDLKKGDWVLLHNGWLAEIADNRKGNIRMATVHGFHTDTGSVYAWDMKWQMDVGMDESGKPRAGRVIADIKLTPKQVKDRQRTTGRF